MPAVCCTLLRLHLLRTVYEPQIYFSDTFYVYLLCITQFMLDVKMLKMLLYKPSLRALSSPRSFETIHNRIIRSNSDISVAKSTAGVMLLAPLELEICSRDSHFIVTACNIRYINKYLYRFMQVMYGVCNCSNQ